jgi:hypothetical protein
MSQQFRPAERFRDELRDAPLEHAATLRRRDPLPAAGPLAVGRTAGSRLGGRRLLVVLVLAAVVAAAILALRSGGALAPQSATAASVLRASAGALDRLGGSRPLGPDDYLYTRTAEWWLYVGYGPHPYMVRSIQEAWLARDGRGRSRYDVVGLSGVDANRSLPFARSSDARLPRHARPFIISTLPSPGILLSYAQRAAANEPHDPPPKPPVPRRGARTELPRAISREWNRHMHERTHTLI